MPEFPNTAGPTVQRPLWRAAGPGLLLSAVAVLALVGASGLPLGTAQHPGPAAASNMLAALLFILGIVVAAEGLLQRRFGGD